jgi:hypothetical protein
MKRMPRTLLAAALALIPAAPIHAQRRLVELPPGTPIRVAAPEVVPARLEGALAGIRSDSLFVAGAADTVGVPLRAVRSLEARIKHTHAATGGRLGLALGGAIGFAVGKGVSCSPGEYICAEQFGPVLLYSALGGFAGLVVGGQIGKYEWQPVTLEGVRLSVFPLAPRGVAVALRFGK